MSVVTPLRDGGHLVAPSLQTSQEQLPFTGTLGLELLQIRGLPLLSLINHRSTKKFTHHERSFSATQLRGFPQFALAQLLRGETE